MFNGIWEVGHGFQVSGLHYLGAGIRSATNYGGDVRSVGAGGSARLRPDGTIVPRNASSSRRRTRPTSACSSGFRSAAARSIDLIAEAFNVFNRPNWTITTQESSANFGQRTSGQNRAAQVGFRLTF